VSITTGTGLRAWELAGLRARIGSSNWETLEIHGSTYNISQISYLLAGQRYCDGVEQPHSGPETRPRSCSHWTRGESPPSRPPQFTPCFEEIPSRQQYYLAMFVFTRCIATRSPLHHQRSINNIPQLNSPLGSHAEDRLVGNQLLFVLQPEYTASLCTSLHRLLGRIALEAQTKVIAELLVPHRQVFMNSHCGQWISLIGPPIVGMDANEVVSR
jgi:hypothetical protein